MVEDLEQVQITQFVYSYIFTLLTFLYSVIHVLHISTYTCCTYILIIHIPSFSVSAIIFIYSWLGDVHFIHNAFLLL